MKIRTIVTITVLILALITISTTTSAATSCDSYDICDICVNETGWWRDRNSFTASETPIQAAVNNAGSGETICVKAGSYTENVDITTSHLTLRGEGAGVVTVTAADPDNHVFEVTADYVNISGFNATGVTDYPYAGIYLGSVDSCNISKNTASNNYYGICLDYSSNNTIVSNTASNNYNGIHLDYSSNNTLMSNTASNNYCGICLDYSSNNTLMSNIASNNNYGIHLDYSSNNTLVSNIALDNYCGICLYSSSNNTIVSNTASSNSYHGIHLDYSGNNKLANNTASSNNKHGIYLSKSSNNTLMSNTAKSNYFYGICLDSSSNNKLANNTANSNNKVGIHLDSSSNNTFANNIVNSNGYCGIYLSKSSNNTLVNCTANLNENFGIYLSSSNNNKLANITANSNSYCGIYLFSLSNNTLVSNTASNNNYGIYLDSSSNNTFANNIVNLSGYCGIHLDKSSNNTLANNTANLNDNFGIYLIYSSNNKLMNNTANLNGDYGIYLSSSSNNTLTSNTANSNDDYGIYLYPSSDNLIYNNYFNNTNNAYDGGSNQWNTTKTNGTNIIGGPFLGGNYWSDYEGVDNDGDGLGDTLTPYNSLGDITHGGDYHPLVPTVSPDPTYIPPYPVNLTHTLGNYWVNYTWSPGNGNVTDSYNVNLNGAWTNRTTSTFANASVSLEGWANITVFAYNASGTGTQSTGCVSDSMQAPAAPVGNCTCGDICVNEVGWWRNVGAFTANTTPIQAAVDNAGSGETICVEAGSYTENVVIRTSHLTLQGEGAGMVTVTAASSSDHVFEVTAYCVNISGFNAIGATNDSYAGFYLGGVDNCNISKNTASNNSYGIRLDHSSYYNTLVNNTVSNNSYGICLDSSSKNTLVNNNASNNSYGIRLDSSSKNTLTNNTMLENKYNFYVFGYSLPGYIQNIDTSNTVDGKPIYYLVDQEDRLIPNDAGFVGVVSGTNITVRDLTLTNNGGGVLFAYTENSRIENVTTSNNSHGIRLYHSSNNMFANNTASNNYDGIYLYSSSNNMLASNTVSNNHNGIRLYHHSGNNTLANNIANSNNQGIYLYSSSNNMLANNTANSNSDNGIDLFNSKNNTLVCNTISNNNHGIYMSGSSNNTLGSNNASSNYHGIDMSFSNNNMLASNTVSNNSYGIFLYSSSDNLIYNNYFNNTNNAFNWGSNQWNTTKTNGTNIIGGPFLGGNYWSDYAGVDNDDDGLGDTLTPYNCGDYHPLVMPDNTPPSGITYLENITHARTYINWTWTDPVDPEFSKVMVYLDGVFQEDVNSGVQCYNATSLISGTTYEIGTLTVDTTGNINQRWVNHSATTASTPDTTPPVISNVTNTDLTTDSITISWITDENSDSVVRYGTTSGNYTNEESGGALVTLHNIPLSGLSEEKTYYYMVYSTDASGNAGEGSEYNFTTTTILDTTAPVISNVTNTDLTADSVTISWITDENSDSVVRYGTTPGNYTNEESGSALVTIHNIPLTGLSEETTYYYMVYSTDASGNTGEGSEYNFTTAVISGNTTIQIGDAIAAPNCYAFTSIIVENVTNLGSGSITVTYNSSVVHVTNVTSGDGNALVIQDWNVDNTAGSVTIAAWDADESHNGDVVFAIVNFHAVGEYMDSTPLTISSPELIEYTGYGIIGHIVTNGTFSVVDKPPMIMDAIATPDMILNDNGRPRVPGTNVTVLNATVNGGSGVANVTIDLSRIGGSDDQVMERIAGTDAWTVEAIATNGINLTHELVVTATDEADNTNTSVIGLTVLLRGDVVRDGDLNSADALFIAKYLVGKEDMSSLLIGDISPAKGDGKITSADALYLAKYLVGKETAP